MTLVKFRKPVTTLPSVFDEFFKEWPTRFDETASFMPSVNIKEEPNQYVIDVHAPGFTKENLSVNVEDDELTITGEVTNQTEKKEERYLTREFRSGSFKRSFNLGGKVNTESIVANYTNGILTITLPKMEQELKRSKAISIG